MILPALFPILAALASTGAASDGWSPRQVQLIKLADAVVAAETWALMNECEILNGVSRHDAAKNRVDSLKPVLAKELGGDFPVYEIFVLRAPVIATSALPPAHCKPKKQYKTEREPVMVRFEQSVEALAAGLESH